jgi:hypothetical protein
MTTTFSPDSAVDATTMAEGRAERFARNPALERLLDELAEVLGPADRQLTDRLERPAMPVALVVGGPRSGSTVTMQFLAASNAFAYPTNLASRFAHAPAIGARIQAMLCDPRYDFRGELGDAGSPIGFESDLGKSRGLLQPNEFWYFWRRFFPIEEPRRLDDGELAEVDVAGFLAGLAAIEEIHGRPLALKGMLLQLNISFLAQILDRVVFVDVARHPFFQCQSILQARRDFFGGLDRWYSIKPPEFDELRHLDPYRQVAGQVHHTRRRMAQEMALAGDHRCVRIGYRAFCDDPGSPVPAGGRALRSHGSPGPSRLRRADSPDGPRRRPRRTRRTRSHSRCLGSGHWCTDAPARGRER